MAVRCPPAAHQPSNGFFDVHQQSGSWTAMPALPGGAHRNHIARRKVLQLGDDAAVEAAKAAARAKGCPGLVCGLG